MLNITILVAKTLGVYFVVSGFFLILRGKTVSNILKDFFDHPAIVFLTGIVLIFLSSAYLIEHNIWDGNWQTIITMFAWFMLLKGLAYMFVPDALNDIAVKKYKHLTNLFGLISIIVGVTLFFIA